MYLVREFEVSGTPCLSPLVVARTTWAILIWKYFNDVVMIEYADDDICGDVLEQSTITERWPPAALVQINHDDEIGELCKRFRETPEDTTSQLPDVQIRHSGPSRSTSSLLIALSVKGLPFGDAEAERWIRLAEKSSHPGSSCLGVMCSIEQKQQSFVVRLIGLHKHSKLLSRVFRHWEEIHQSIRTGPASSS